MQHETENCICRMSVHIYKLHRIFQFKYEKSADVRRLKKKQENMGCFLLLQIRRSIYNEVDLRFPDRLQTFVWFDNLLGSYAFRMYIPVSRAGLGAFSFDGEGSIELLYQIMGGQTPFRTDKVVTQQQLRSH